MAERARQRAREPGRHRRGDRYLRQPEGPGSIHAGRNLQPRPARGGARDPDWGCRLRHRKLLGLHRQLHHTIDPNGVTTVTHNNTAPGGGLVSDGVDRLINIERLQFADQSITIAGVNNDPLGTLTILDAATNTPDDTPTEGQRLRASIAGVTDRDNVTPA